MLKLYIANLGKYNEGELVGGWLTLPYTEEELNDLFVEIKLGYYDEDGDYVHGYEEDGSFYEEYAIHDFECDVEGVEVGEYSNIEELNEIAEKLESLDDFEMKMLEAIIDFEGGDILSHLDNIDEYRLFEGVDDEYDLGYYWMEESGCYDIPKHLQNYIDYEKFGRDYSLETNGSFTLHGWIERD